MDMPVNPLLYRFIGVIIILIPMAKSRLPTITRATLLSMCFLSAEVKKSFICRYSALTFFQ